MALQTVQRIIFDGLDPTYSAVNAQDTYDADNSQMVFLHVKNGGGSSINVTINAVKTSVTVKNVGSLTISDKVVAVPAGGERLIGPISPAYADSAGLVTIDYSGTTSVTAAVLRLDD